MSYAAFVRICHIFISPGHNYYGHHGMEPDNFPLLEQKRVECMAGRGLRGDRFFDFREDYKGQITFFAQEIFDRLSADFPEVKKSPAVLRRNVIVSGIDLNSLVGREFSMQGVRFLGMAECSPCHWMNRAFAPGAEEWLRGNGGLRARILGDGVLSVGEAQLVAGEAADLPASMPV
jgi:MOSC domain-containing protein YiiM